MKIAMLRILSIISIIFLTGFYSMVSAMPISVNNNTHNTALPKHHDETDNTLCVSGVGGSTIKVAPDGQEVAIGDATNFKVMLKCDSKYTVTVSIKPNSVEAHPQHFEIDGHKFHVQVKPHYIEPKGYVLFYVSEDGA